MSGRCKICGSPTGHNADCLVSIRERNEEIARLRTENEALRKRVAALEIGWSKFSIDQDAQSLGYRAAIEDAAKWHDEQAADYHADSFQGDINERMRRADQAEFHEYSAAAILALGEK